MSEEDLQLLITLDDPVDPPEEDTFNHLVANNLGYWFAQRFSAWRRLDQPAEAAGDAYKVTFGQGDWTCTLSRLSGATNGSMKGTDVEVCTVTRWTNGEIVEQKLFYDPVNLENLVNHV